MQQVFDPDNLWWRFVSRCVDVVGLSVFWAVLCLPVVTVVPLSSALYYTVVKCFRQGERETFHVFYRAVRENLRQGVIASLICLPVAAALVFGYAVMRSNWSSDLGAVMFVAYDVALMVPAEALFIASIMMSISISFGLIWVFKELFNGTNSFFKWACKQTYAVYIVHLPLMILIQFLTDGMITRPIPEFLFIGVVSLVASFLISWGINALLELPKIRK